MFRRLSLVLLVAAACEPHAADRALPKAARVEAPPSWCSAVDAALGQGDTRGFACLPVPNFLLTGFYGPKRNPERSDFVNACFGGNADVAARLRMNVRPVGSLSFRYSARQKRMVGGGVDLGFLGPWAPKVRAKSARARALDIDVKLEDAEIRVLPSVAEILGQELQRAAESSELRATLASCIGSICDGATEPIVYTAKVLAAVPVITLHADDSAEDSLEIAEAVASFEVDRTRSSRSTLVLRAKEKLNIAALLEAARPAFESSRTCARVQAAKTRHEVLSGLRELGLRALAGRALDEIPKATEPLRTATRSTDGAFSANEQKAILDGIETIDGAARQLALAKPNNTLCAVRSLAQVVLSGPSEDNRVHATVVDVVQPIFDRLTELANAGSLPCAEPQWYLDLDRDGFGDRAKSQRASVQPPGHVANALDCYDQNPEAHPGQARFFPLNRGDGGFDYDCDGQVAKAEQVVSGGCREVTILGYPTKCWADPGWLGGVPECGQQGRWLAECEVSALSCTAVKEARTVQGCR